MLTPLYDYRIVSEMKTDLTELQYVFNTLSSSDQTLLRDVERNLLVEYDVELLVPASRTYRTAASQPVHSVFDFHYAVELLPGALQRALAVVVKYASLGSRYSFAALGTLANDLGTDKYGANKQVRRLAELGFLALTKEPSRQGADAANPYHWRLKSYLHPVLLNEDEFISQLLGRYEEIKAGQSFRWQGEKRSEIVDNLLTQNVTVQPTVLNEKRPAFSSFHWSSLDANKQSTILLQSPTDLIIRVPEGVTVLDFDSQEKLAKFLLDNPGVKEIFESTFTVRTPRGFHFWFKSNHSYSSRNTELFDIRSSGSWLVVPSGGVEREVVCDEELKYLPIDLSEHKTTQVKVTPQSVTFTELTEGNRNNGLFRKLRALRLKSPGSAAYHSGAAVLAMGCVPRLPRSEEARLIKHAWEYKNREGFSYAAVC